jgi:microcystin-dependent protein
VPFLTPDVSLLSLAKTDRLVSCADGLFFIISGALLELSNANNWEEFGSATAQETADYFFGVYEEFIMSLIVMGQLAGIGAVAGFVTSFVPVGWLKMDGVLRDGANYPELFSVLPTAWKSGGNVTLPDMAGAVLAGVGTNGSRTFTLGVEGGVTDVALTESQLASHKHDLQGETDTPDDVEPENNYLPTWEEGDPHYSLGGSAFVAMGAQSISLTGSGDAHENMPPHVVVTWAVFAGR